MRRRAALVALLSVPFVALAGEGADFPTGDWVGCYEMYWPDGTVRYWGYLYFSIGEDGAFDGSGDLANNPYPTPQEPNCRDGESIGGGYWTAEVKSGWFHPDGRPFWFMDMSDNDNNVFLMAEMSELAGDTWSFDYWLTGLPAMPGHADMWPGAPVFKDPVGLTVPAPEVTWPDCRPPDVLPFCPETCSDPPCRRQTP